MIIIKNIGENEFPSGNINYFNIEYSREARHKIHIKRVEKIAPGKEQYLSEVITPLNPGIAWIKIKIEPDDGKKILYYQEEAGKDLGFVYWTNAIYVINKEFIEIISLLKDIKENLLKKKNIHRLGGTSDVR